MRYVEAFNKLGYHVLAPKTDWSAGKDDSVCLTLWKSEVTWTPPPPHMDLWNLHAPGCNAWEKLPGHAKRTTHLKRAWSEFEGIVDVIIVSGIPGEGVKSADPWKPTQRDNHIWRLTKFDEATGFFSIAAEKRN